MQEEENEIGGATEGGKFHFNYLNGGYSWREE